MANVYQIIAQVILGVAETTIYTVPAATYVIGVCRFCNVDTAARTVTIYARRAGAAASDTTSTQKSLSIPVASGYDEVIPGLGPTDVLSALTDSASKVSATFWGTIIT